MARQGYVGVVLLNCKGARGCHCPPKRFIGYVAEASNSPCRPRQDRRWICPPCRREQNNRLPPCFWARIQKCLQISAAMIVTLYTAVGEVLAALFFFAFIAVLSFYLPSVSRVWKPELKCLQRSVDKMGSDLVFVHEGLKATERSVCKLYEESKINSQKSCIEKLGEKLGLKSASETKKIRLPPTTEENSSNYRVIRNPSEEFCETSRKLYKKPLKNEKVRHSDSSNQLENPPDYPSSIFQKW